MDIKISIHAPAKGATGLAGVRYPQSVFQSTLPRRERRGAEHENRSDYKFQSTLPRRERPPQPFNIEIHYTYFNPRSREGSDDPLPDRI